MVCACVHTQVPFAWFLGLKTLSLKKEDKNPSDMLKKSRLRGPCSFRYQLFCALNLNGTGQILRTAAARSVLLCGGVQTRTVETSGQLAHAWTPLHTQVQGHTHIHTCTRVHRPLSSLDAPPFP